MLLDFWGSSDSNRLGFSVSFLPEYVVTGFDTGSGLFVSSGLTSDNLVGATEDFALMEDFSCSGASSMVREELRRVLSSDVSAKY